LTSLAFGSLRAIASRSIAMIQEID